MTTIRIPKDFRPGGYLKPCNLGIDLPAWFIEGVQSLDSKIYPIFQPFNILYEDITNNYVGSEDDPRYHIHINSSEYGQQEIWGWVLKLPNGNPKLDNCWHLWRLCEVGWAHIIKIESVDLEYLKIILEELYFTARITEKYGLGAASAYRREKDKLNKEKEISNNNQLFKDVLNENKGIMKKVVENYSMGRIAATNPTIDKITSYNNQKNHSRIVRPLDDLDKESGLIIPDNWKN